VRVDLVMLDRIVREQLNMSKISACWMPRIFTRKIKKKQIQCLEKNRELMQAEWDQFRLWLFVG